MFWLDVVQKVAKDWPFSKALMLKKQNRLKKRSDFNYIFRKGQPCKSRFVVFYYAKNNSNDVKVGIVVSKKIGNSVTRNRVKRLLREAVKANLEQIKTGYNLIFIARSGIEKLTLAEIEATVKDFLISSKLV